MTPHVALGTMASAYHAAGGTAPGLSNSSPAGVASPSVLFPPMTTQTTITVGGFTLTGTTPITLTAVWEADSVEMIGQNDVTFVSGEITADLDIDGYYPPFPKTINIELVELRASNGISPDAVLTDVVITGVVSIP